MLHNPPVSTDRNCPTLSESTTSEERVALFGISSSLVQESSTKKGRANANIRVNLVINLFIKPYRILIKIYTHHNTTGCRCNCREGQCRRGCQTFKFECIIICISKFNGKWRRVACSIIGCRTECI